MAGSACLPLAQQQQQVFVSRINGSSSRFRALLNRALPCAVAFPSLVSLQRRSNLSVKFHEFRGSAVSQQVAESTSETVADLVVEAAHSRSFEGVQTEQGDFSSDFLRFFSCFLYFY